MRKIVKITAFLLAMLTVALFALSCNESKPEDKVFENSSFKITLDDSYISSESSESGNVTFVSYDSGCAIVAKNESFEHLAELKHSPDTMTVKEYATVIIEDNKYDATVKEDGALVYFEHTIKNENDGNYKYFSVVYKSTDAFWILRFGCVEEIYEENRADFVRFAKSVIF